MASCGAIVDHADMDDTIRWTPARRATLIGMVHLGALPGTPRANTPLDAVVDAARSDARTLAAAGFDAVLIENLHDRPYLRGAAGPEIVAATTRATLAVKDAAPDLPLGVQILAGANREALAVALACGADFVRVEGFVFSSIADEGLFDEADAGPLLRYRRTIGAEHVSIFADVKKKHGAHAITADVDLAETVWAAWFSGADGVVVTGTATGSPTDPQTLAAARLAAGDRPVLVGSGVTPENAGRYTAEADGLIVGTAIKRGGDWDERVDGELARKLVDAVRTARAGG